MCKALAHWIRLLAAFVVFAASAAGAAGGDRIVLVADSRRAAGWMAWWMNVYNDSHFWFALLTVVIIPALGLLMAMATGLLMGRLGINLKNRVLVED